MGWVKKLRKRVKKAGKRLRKDAKKAERGLRHGARDADRKAREKLRETERNIRHEAGRIDDNLDLSGNARDLDRERRRLIENVSSESQALAEKIGKLIAEGGMLIAGDELVARLLWPIIELYKEHLRRQAEGRWKALDQEFVSAAQEFYPEIDLSKVRYAEDIDTLHGQHITFHYRVYFAGRIDLRSSANVHLMLHELEHVLQYERRGGEKAFLSEYILKVAGKIIETGRINVHDYLDMERAAIRKADNIADVVFQRL